MNKLTLAIASLIAISLLSVSAFAALPNITSWENNKTSNDTLAFTVNTSELVMFNVTANQTVTYAWTKNGVAQSSNLSSVNISWIANGTKTVIGTVTNVTNGSANKTWTVTVGTTVCDYPQELNVTTYANDSNPTCTAGGAAGNLSAEYIDWGDLTATYVSNLTTSTNLTKVFNESSSNWTSRIGLTIWGLDNSTNYTIKIYNGTSGNLSQDFYGETNSTGYLTYNTSGFNDSRWTNVSQTTAVTTYTIRAWGATVVIDAVNYILQRFRMVVG